MRTFETTYYDSCVQANEPFLVASVVSTDEDGEGEEGEEEEEGEGEHDDEMDDEEDDEGDDDGADDLFMADMELEARTGQRPRMWIFSFVVEPSQRAVLCDRLVVLYIGLLGVEMKNHLRPREWIYLLLRPLNRLFAIF